MINTTEIPEFLTAQREEQFLNAIKSNDTKTSKKYYLIALLQSDCGLRVSETVQLKIENFNFTKNEIRVKSLKKKNETWRTIPMTKRVVNACADYFQTLDDTTSEAWIFPAVKEARAKVPYLSRKQVWQYFKDKSEGEVHPHMLRHTAATKLVENGASILTVRDILGHSYTTTTEIYTHASEERKRAAMQSIERTHIPFWQKWVAKIYPSVLEPKKVHVLPMATGWTKFHVGRERELSHIIDLTEKRVNVLITGAQGIGKTHILDNLKLDNILRIDDTSRFRLTLAGTLLHLMEGDKDKISQMLGLNPEIITKESTKRLCELLCQITEKNEYTIVIDRADELTPSVVKALEMLRNHFHFIVAARQVKISAATWLTNFEKVQIKPLSRQETMLLISRASNDFRNQIEDYEAFKNHVWNQATGVPQFTLELIDRFRKEGFVSAEKVLEYHHTAARSEIDMSTVILLGLACLMIFRYVAGEVNGGEDSGAFKLIGGIALIFALFARQIFKAAKRKYV